MRIGIAGAGGVGGLIGALLANQGLDVAFLARGAHRDAMREHGLHVRGTLGELTARRFAVSDRGSDLGTCDVVFVAVKTFQLDAMLPHLRGLVGERTIVVPLLNGIASWDLLAGELGERNVVGGIVYVNSWVDSPGLIKQVGSFVRVVMGERHGGTSSRLEEVAALLVPAGIEVELERDVRRRNWEKFLGFEPMALVGALSRSSIGTFRAEPGTRALLIGLMNEVTAIGRRAGIALSDDAVARRMTIVDGLAHDATISMQRDVMSGRRSEFMEQSIGLVELAKRIGVDVPLHDLCVPLVLLQERAARSAP